MVHHYINWLIRWFITVFAFFLWLVVRKWWNKNPRMCKEKQYMKQKIENKYLLFSWSYCQSVSLKCYLYKFFTFLFHHCWSHHTLILVVGSFHHTSCSIHLTSFTISNRLYWIHLELVCCQVAHISIWSIGSPLYQLADSLVHHRLRFFLWLVDRKWWNKNTRMCKEKQDIKQKIENKYLEFSWK